MNNFIPFLSHFDGCYAALTFDFVIRIPSLLWPSVFKEVKYFLGLKLINLFYLQLRSSCEIESGSRIILMILGAGTVVSQSIGDKFTRNTLRFNGASVGYRSGYKSEVKLNDISRQCWGMLQHDGAGIQAQVNRQTKILLQQNWIHFSPKYGLRFDGGPPKIGRHGTMKQNVVKKTNGMMVKGDYHTVDHNLIFHKFTKAGDHDGQGSKCNLCVLRLVIDLK